MKPVYLAACLLAGCLVPGHLADATMVDVQNWADEVVSYSDNIQNYSGHTMATDTEWWLVGPSDADLNGNGYAWDDGVDQDSVAGWRADAPDQSIVVKFDLGLADVQGNDLVIHMYCGPKANASVWAGVDSNSYTQIGSIVGGDGPGVGGFFYDAEFDFDGLLAGDVHYVKVQRVANKDKTGMFFDSFASTPLPEPTTLPLLGLGTLLILARWMLAHRRVASS